MGSHTEYGVRYAILGESQIGRKYYEPNRRRGGMIVKKVCKYCDQLFEWDNGLERIIISDNVYWAPMFCSDECQEASENEIDRKAKERPEFELKQLECNVCGHYQFYRTHGWEQTIAPPNLHFSCRNCGSNWWINAGDIYSFDGNHMVVKDLMELGGSGEPHEYNGEYKWTSDWKDFERHNRFWWPPGTKVMFSQKMGMACLDSRFMTQGIIDRDPSKGGLICENSV
jgi:hypothetical protein